MTFSPHRSCVLHRTRHAVAMGLALLVWPHATPAVADAGAPATNLLGAAGVLARIPEILAQAHATNQADTAASPRTQFQKDLAGFTASATNLAPEQAAAAWLALCDRFWLLPPAHGDEDRSAMAAPDERLSFGSVLAAIPGPDSWAALLQLAGKRKPAEPPAPAREAELRYLAALLAGDVPAMKAAAASLDAQARKADRYTKERLREAVRELQAGLLRRADSLQPEGVLAAFRKTLEMQTNNAAEAVCIEIPDLAALTDAPDALGLIDQVLAVSNVVVTVPAGPETQAIVQRRIVAHIDRIQKPQWGMVCTADAGGVSLFEALNRKFGGKKPDEDAGKSVSRFMNANSYGSYGSGESDQNVAQARQVYVFGLLATGRRAEAVTFALTLDTGDLEWDSRHEHLPVDRATLFAFFDDLLRQRPELGLWRPYAALALETGKTNEAAELILKNAPARFATTAQLRDASERVGACLTLDEIPQAVALIRKVLAADTSRLPAEAQSQALSTRVELALSLAQVGKLLKDPAWVQEGLSAACAACRQGWTGGRNGANFYENSRIARTLTAHQEFAAAEAFVLEGMAAQQKAGTTASYGEDSSHSLAGALQDLLRIYAAAGRPADVVALLDQAPWWGVPDLASSRGYDYYSGCGEEALDPLAAAALHATGRDEDAVRILKAYLYEKPGDDDAYGVLTAIEGPKLIPWLEALYARDRFEERPLIWKAWLLMKDGQLDDAEQTVRAALKVDPTDGEEKAGDRVRGYAVLGDILEAKGKKEDAAFFHNVVQSVRVAEEGDRFTQAGLLTRSLPLYEKAQGLFGDAYCVQWRLAERLAAMGNIAAAEEHYRIAFERMPEQFGQVANFCFGCEGVFRSDHSRSVAERVLTGLEKSGPKRPQVYYLLGQLRESQERLTEAYAYYKKATDMDPGYLDAWQKLEGLSKGLFLSQAERDALALRMLSLDPLQRHACVDLSEVYDFKGLWNAVAANQKYAWTPPKSVYPLKASAAKLEEEKKQAAAEPRARGFNRGYMDDYRWQSSRERLPTPGHAIAENETVRQAAQLMECGAGESENAGAEVEM